MKISFPLIAASGVIFAGAVGAAVYFTVAPGSSSVPAREPQQSVVSNPALAPTPALADTDEPHVPKKLYENKKLGFSVALAPDYGFVTDERNAVMFSADAKSPWLFSIDAVGKGIYEYHVPVYEDTEAWLAAQAQTEPSVDVPSIKFLQRVYGADGTKFVVYAQYMVLATSHPPSATLFGRQLAATAVVNGRIYTITARATYPMAGDLEIEPAFLDLVQSFTALPL